MRLMSSRELADRPYEEVRKMSASRSVVAILAAVIALLGCGFGKNGPPPANAAGAAQARAAGWTLGGVPCCTLIAVPAAAPPVGTGACPGVRPGAIVLTDVGQCTLNFLFQDRKSTRLNSS